MQAFAFELLVFGPNFKDFLGRLSFDVMPGAQRIVSYQVDEQRHVSHVPLRLGFFENLDSFFGGLRVVELLYAVFGPSRDCFATDYVGLYGAEAKAALFLVFREECSGFIGKCFERFIVGVGCVAG